MIVAVIAVDAMQKAVTLTVHRIIGAIAVAVSPAPAMVPRRAKRVRAVAPVGVIWAVVPVPAIVALAAERARAVVAAVVAPVRVAVVVVVANPKPQPCGE